jgi:hypothetical protein
VNSNCRNQHIVNFGCFQCVVDLVAHFWHW